MDFGWFSDFLKPETVPVFQACFLGTPVEFSAAEFEIWAEFQAFEDQPKEKCRLCGSVDHREENGILRPKDFCGFEDSTVSWCPSRPVNWDFYERIG